MADRQVVQRFALARGQRPDVGVALRLYRADQRFHQMRGHFGRKDIVAVQRLADRFDEKVGVDVFQQKTVRPLLHALDKLVAVFGHGEHHHFLFRIAAQYLPQRLPPVHHRHI